jgi:HD-GYP domain-containing protein (c-di-GMP phosphodiesterase class II)/CHASE2 domain-containing sensor protein
VRKRGAVGRRRAAPGLTILAAGVAAVALALAGDVLDVLAAQEQDTVALRYQLRGEQPVSDVAVVAIDDASISHLGIQWPFPRSLHARAIDRLRAEGARLIVYDVQFTEQTRPREDMALFEAVRRAPGTVLVTSETGTGGEHEILGGPENLRDARAVAAAANLVTAPGDVLQRFRGAENGLPTVGEAAARAARARRRTFPAEGAWIDFRGPPGTIPTVSFADLLSGAADTSRLRGRIVIVGATAPTLGDVHPVPTANHELMSGAEVQANAIWTALHGLPMRDAPPWVGWLAIAVMGLAPALASLSGRALRGALVAPLLGLCWLIGVQVCFQRGIILPVSYPLIALVLGTMTATTSAFVLEREHRRRTAQYSEQLELEVTERTEELRETQLEIVSRLGRAVESRDADTGTHLDRMSALCHRLALAVGMPPAEAELLRHASVLHDVGKVGIPDRILRKPGRFDAGERAVMQTHASIGAEILAGSSSALIQLAAVIARSHHERWDGEGYPDGLRGEQIPLAARICTVCDVFDALLSVRPYKPAWPLADALAELTAQRGRQFDPALVDAFVTLVGSLEPELLAPGGAPAEIGVLTEPVAETPPRSPRGAGSGPADVAGTSSSRPAAPSPPARG